jgi:hypothetical protein
MLRKFLVSALILTTILTSVTIWVKLFDPQPQTRLIVIHREKPEEITPSTEIPDIIQEINDRKSQILSMACEDIRVKIWQGGMRFRLFADLFYEKPLNFRMRIESNFGNELDLGANEVIFWYWSRRNKHPGLYWAYYEDYHKTRLKTPFSPIFIRQTLGLEEIDMEGAKLADTSTDLIVVHERTNSMGNPVLYSTFIDKSARRINGFMVTHTDGKPVASAEIRKWHNDLPAEILYVWHEEDRALLLEINRPRANVEISESSWTPPDYRPRINMAEE